MTLEEYLEKFPGFMELNRHLPYCVRIWASLSLHQPSVLFACRKCGHISQRQYECFGDGGFKDDSDRRHKSAHLEAVPELIEFLLARSRMIS